MKKLNEPLTCNDLKNKRIVFLTGAGMSVSSGVACYWGENGTYAKLEKKYGKPIDVVLSESNFKANPEEVWQYMKDLLVKPGDIVPSQDYLKINDIQSIAKAVNIYTQNCDGLHIEAGNANVVQIHGNAKEAVCTKCCTIAYNAYTQLEEKNVPTCPRCKSDLKPNIVLFEGNCRMNHPQAMYHSHLADLMIIVGTQAYFTYITDLINGCASANGRVILVDIEKPLQLESNKNISGKTLDIIEYFSGGGEKFFSEMIKI